MDKQYREAFAKAVKACRQAHELNVNLMVTSGVVDDAKRKQEAWDNGHEMLGKLV
ncbi:hypothetical protein AGMMS50233_04500 [Endomicrobiia bacterium]|nr:hypothetical protein AGMMS50233_04500 [Endomicrobiia bacterium]